MKTVNQILAGTTSNCVLDSGADTCLLGASFRMISFADQVARVGDFDNSLMVDALKIGSGVTAYDKEDGTTVLLQCNEFIAHTTQANLMLSSN